MKTKKQRSREVRPRTSLHPSAPGPGLQRRTCIAALTTASGRSKPRACARTTASVTSLSSGGAQARAKRKPKRRVGSRVMRRSGGTFSPLDSPVARTRPCSSSGSSRFLRPDMARRGCASSARRILSGLGSLRDTSLPTSKPSRLGCVIPTLRLYPWPCRVLAVAVLSIDDSSALFVFLHKLHSIALLFIPRFATSYLG
jgi:hypothetical protein